MCSGSRFSVSKKSGCAGLFRQIHKKCLRQGAQTPRPPGKAGRYELTLEGLRALQTSQNGFLTVGGEDDAASSSSPSLGKRR